jgi:DNA-binding transcriptional LysR family regulator
VELRQVRYFIAVAEELHFGRAARRLGISQPPLSHQIKTLEKSIGTILFERTKHHVRLTKVGEATLIEAYRLLEQAERVRATATQPVLDRTRSLKIGCLSSAISSVLPRIIDDLRQLHPEIGVTVLDVETMTGIAAVEQAVVDVAVIRPEQVTAPLAMQPFMRDRLLAVVPSSHPLASRKRIQLKQLAGEPLIAFSRQNQPRRYDAIIASCHKAGFSPNLVHYSTTVQSQIGRVACGLGIALLPTLVRDWNMPGVVYRDIDPPVETNDLSAVWNRTAAPDTVDDFLTSVGHVYGSTRSARRHSAK